MMSQVEKLYLCIWLAYEDIIHYNMKTHHHIWFSVHIVLQVVFFSEGDLMSVSASMSAFVCVHA